MCGIAGIVDPCGADFIRRMTDAIVHRGPDDDGFYIDDRVALGNRRLSIIDLEGGRQPIANESGDLQMVCNGEIYNSPQLRQELESKGHRFRTKTDIEVIPHLYEEHGRNCVRYLRGMFAFGLWDRRHSRLLLARDHLGQKPVFWARQGDTLLFASEIKALLATGWLSPSIDLEALWHYVSLRYLPGQHSLFEGIYKLPAASTLELDLVPEGVRLSVERYWKPDFSQKFDLPELEIAEGLDELLRETVGMHLLSDVPVGAFLSGGIDSSMVTAMMARATQTPVPTFSIGVKEQGFNELPYARQVAESCGTEPHERIIEADMIHLIPKMIWQMDEPADPFGVGVYLVSELASQHVKVVQGGDGGDENFGGYDRFAGQRLVDYYCILPAWLRRSVMRRLIARIPENFSYKSIAQKARWMNEMSFFDDGARYAHSMSFLRFTQEAKSRLFTAMSRSQIADPDSAARILEHFEADNLSELVDRMLYTDLMTRMPDHLLMIVDRMSMAHSLETRSPLIDHRVVEYAARIPGRLKVNGTCLKYILRCVAARYLPKELVTRKKQGFGFPLGVWMRTDLRRFLTNLFDDSRFVAEGIFEREAMQGLLEEHLSGRVDHNYRLWILINLEIWYRIYFENQSLEALSEYTDRMSAA